MPVAQLVKGSTKMHIEVYYGWALPEREETIHLIQKHYPDKLKEFIEYEKKRYPSNDEETIMKDFDPSNFLAIECELNITFSRSGKQAFVGVEELAYLNSFCFSLEELMNEIERIRSKVKVETNPFLDDLGEGTIFLDLYPNF